ncbi:hypothetical protein [Pseudorhodoferax sp. Leaf265]|uniref:hypothetical protein n=1 Tax=Pseudorhodoferax sp. Leaf265 TaxID=1736315 RepID=UPI0006FFDFE9|nr:hypothetical protein [Pseudorhodoferax sp. Leaf265]KQP21335.1 hypothetical protein ASF45_03930 [Pseudorhodoferax sp. Leaf265]
MNEVVEALASPTLWVGAIAGAIVAALLVYPQRWFDARLEARRAARNSQRIEAVAALQREAAWLFKHPVLMAAVADEAARLRWSALGWSFLGCLAFLNLAFPIEPTAPWFVRYPGLMFSFVVSAVTFGRSVRLFNRALQRSGLLAYVLDMHKASYQRSEQGEQT